MNKLTFGFGNAKLAATIATFSLPAGHSCPGANECLCKANKETGKLTDGPENVFRCFSATAEARATTVRNARWHNFDSLMAAKDVQGMADLINNSIPFGIAYVRVHVSGDFFNETYFKAWLNVAINNPAIIFYGYTKSLSFLVKYKKQMPANFRFTASKGGKWDALIAKHDLVSAEVVFSTEEARRKGLEIDHDDTLAIKAEKSFALLLHGGQPKGTPAAKAWAALIKTIGGYKKGKSRAAKVQPAKSIMLAVA